MCIFRGFPSRLCRHQNHLFSPKFVSEQPNIELVKLYIWGPSRVYLMKPNNLVPLQLAAGCRLYIYMGLFAIYCMHSGALCNSVPHKVMNALALDMISIFTKWNQSIVNKWKRWAKCMGYLQTTVLFLSQDKNKNMRRRRIIYFISRNIFIHQNI